MACDAEELSDILARATVACGGLVRAIDDAGGGFGPRALSMRSECA